MLEIIIVAPFVAVTVLTAYVYIKEGLNPPNTEVDSELKET